MDANENLFYSELSTALKTSCIDASLPSSADYRIGFISNDPKRKQKVASVIESELLKCTSFIFSVAFISQSGITPLLQTFGELEKRGIPGKILTTDYLSFSEPRALQRLNKFSNIEIRMYRTDHRTHGFHTKGYLFQRADKSCRAIIGSSNLTGSAIAENKEWNTRIAAMPQGELMDGIMSEFDDVWNKASSLDDIIDTYEILYEKKRQMIYQTDVVSLEQVRLEPNAMQLNFVTNLSKVLESGETRALLISATGTGKTYASAFAMRHIHPSRILFLAHREQILKQSIQTYKKVFGTTKTFGLLSGNHWQADADYVFATMQTMAKDTTLEQFDPQEFEIIIIDEVHRAGSESYEKILNYYDAEFYLGMTASPDRPDGFDIYGLFDNNIAYEIRLQGALEEGLLCPFHYFGISDLVVDGFEIDDKTELTDFQYLVSDERVRHVIEKINYYGFSGDRAKGLIFCSSNKEAAELSSKFNQKSFRTVALSGKDSQEVREKAVYQLSSNDDEDALDYIFTVDIFNEGIDIPDVNQIIMLRPTESPIIFIQQLGRGLRRTDDKEFVVILDFIGNYRNNFMIPLALSGDRSYNKDTIRKYVMEGSRVIPGASSVHFDEVSRDRIFRSIDQSSITLRLLREKYFTLKHKLGRIPSMRDFLDHSEIDPLLFVEKKGSYHAFLKAEEAEYSISFSQGEELILEYVSRFIANGMRPHELLMLRDLVNGEAVQKNVLEQNLREYFAIEFREADYDSSVRVLSKGFLSSAGDKAKYEDIELIEICEESGNVLQSTSFTEMLKHADFRNSLLEIVEFGLERNREKFSSASNNLTLYEKYTRKDVCRLLNWQKDESSTIYGYRTKHETCPIFVTYEKEDDIASSTRYEDAFIDNKTFSWMTRSRLTSTSREVQEIIHADEAGIDMHLFVKQSDDEGSDFYYLGQVHPGNYAETSIQNDSGEFLPIVNFKLLLENPVREDLYDYFTASA